MKEIISTLELLEALNKTKGVYTEKELLEEKENINEMEHLYLRLEKALHALKNLSNISENMAAEQLIELHLVYSDFIWQYDQIHEMIIKMIKMYR